MADGRHNENRKKLRYFNNHLSDFDEIWHSDAQNYQN